MRDRIQKDIRKTLAKNHACYILITCDEPTADGSMNVEISYEGDSTVASYLLQGAQTFMDEQECLHHPVRSTDSNKIHHL